MVTHGSCKGDPRAAQNREYQHLNSGTDNASVRQSVTSRISLPGPSSKRPSTGTQAFKGVLQGVKARQPALGLTVKVAAPAGTVSTHAARAQAQTLAVARSRVDAEAERLGVVRAHHTSTAEVATEARVVLHEGAEHKGSARLVDLLVKELVAEFEGRSGVMPSSKAGNFVQPLSSLHEVPFHLGANTTPGQRPAPTAEVKANQATALIERIDTFVRSQRPALALTLNNSLGARVELEKLGPGRIALRLIGQNGPPTADTVNRIRDELTARGLKVGALSVA
jgi:hypothetical protein